MNSCKKTTNNWILCPSKSIPGKFYYFNVATGEAVWGLDDAQVFFYIISLLIYKKNIYCLSELKFFIVLFK